MTPTDQKELISWLESRYKDTPMPGANRMFKLALEAVREQENEPLTLEQLREMDGEPVWLKDGIGEGWFLTGAIAETKIYFYEKSITVGEPLSGCAKTWLAYRRPPERSENE